MPLHKTQNGKAATCEYPACERLRGAPLKSVFVYGCVLCTSCEYQYQRGNISLPDAADNRRKERAEMELLG